MQALSPLVPPSLNHQQDDSLVACHNFIANLLGGNATSTVGSTRNHLRHQCFPSVSPENSRIAKLRKLTSVSNAVHFGTLIVEQLVSSNAVHSQFVEVQTKGFI